MQWIKKCLNTRFNKLHTKANNLENKTATEKKLWDVDKKIAEVSVLEPTAVLNTKIR